MDCVEEQSLPAGKTTCHSKLSNKNIFNQKNKNRFKECILK